MLTSIFSFRGCDYKGNRIPESVEQLQEAANKILLVHNLRMPEPVHPQDLLVEKNLRFIFTYSTDQDKEETKITDDQSLRDAINLAFQGPNESNMIIKYHIYETTPLPFFSKPKSFLLA